MDGDCTKFRRALTALAVAAVLTVGSPVFSCPLNTTNAGQAEKVAGEGKQPENRNPRERCKRSEKSNNNSKTCPDGGERLPQDKQRSPLDDVPPLAPLVA